MKANSYLEKLYEVSLEIDFSAAPYKCFDLVLEKILSIGLRHGRIKLLDSDSDGVGNDCDLFVTTTSLPPARVGNSYSETLAAVRGTPPYTWSLLDGFLPAELSLSTGGVISGDVTAGGFTANFTVQVMDDNGDTTTRPLKIRSKIPGCYSCHLRIDQ